MLLTTLANVKLWLMPAGGTPNTTSDALLNQLIARCSAQILAAINRPDLTQTTFTDTFDGVPPSGRMMLQNWPVLSVSSVSVNNTTIPPSQVRGSSGWTLESWDGSLPGIPQRVGITGYGQRCGNQPGYSPANIGIAPNGTLAATFGSWGSGNFQNVAITYTAGYVISGETQTIPNDSTYKVTPNQPQGIWAADSGVTFKSNGVALVPVASNPVTGQYVPPQPWAASPTTSYQFAAADAGKQVVLNYSFIPYGLEQGCIEWVGERFRYKDRIGLRSQTIMGQETTSYQLGMPDVVSQFIMPYATPFPL